MQQVHDLPRARLYPVFSCTPTRNREIRRTKLLEHTDHECVKGVNRRARWRNLNKGQSAPVCSRDFPSRNAGRWIVGWFQVIKWGEGVWRMLTKAITGKWSSRTVATSSSLATQVTSSIARSATDPQLYSRRRCVPRGEHLAPCPLQLKVLKAASPSSNIH